MSEKTRIKICIDGPDKTGKETQTKRLQQNLEARGLMVRKVEVPISDRVFHPKIYAMLKDGTAVRYPEMFQTFQAANRMMWQHKNWESLDQCDVVIFDRWDVSSWVYGQASGLSVNFLHACLSTVHDLDFYYIFDGEPFPTPEREDDSYEKNKVFMAKVRFHYRKWQQDNLDISMHVNANRDIEIVEKELLDDFTSRFPHAGHS